MNDITVLNPILNNKILLFSVHLKQKLSKSDEYNSSYLIFKSRLFKESPSIQCAMGFIKHHDRMKKNLKPNTIKTDDPTKILRGYYPEI